MFVMVDNYDSFVHVLVMYFRELGQEVTVVRNDAVSIKQLEDLYAKKVLQGIIISPGPKSPADSGMSVEIVQKMASRVPILGVCLGHQVIGYAYGAGIKKGKHPMHGKVTAIRHQNSGVFRNLPSGYEVTRYHSLIVCGEGLPDCLQAEAWDEAGTIMALRHRCLPVYGVQFHPEAVLTQHGHGLLKNFIEICGYWWRENEDAC